MISPVSGNDNYNTLGYGTIGGVVSVNNGNGNGNAATKDALADKLAAASTADVAPAAGGDSSNGGVVAQPATPTDTVQLSPESVTLANAADTAASQQTETQATQSAPAPEQVNEQAAATDQAVTPVAAADQPVSDGTAVTKEEYAADASASNATDTAAAGSTAQISSAAATQAVDNLEAALNGKKVSNKEVKNAVMHLQAAANNGEVGADLADRAISLLEQAMEAHGRGAKKVVSMAKDLKNQLVVSSKTQELESLVNSLGDAYADNQTINDALATMQSDLEQAQADYANGTISKDQLAATTIAALDTGIASINSAIQEAEAAATAPAEAATEELPPGLAKKEEVPPGLENKEEVPPGLEKKEELPPGLEKQEEVPPGLAKKLGELFATIENIVNIITSQSEGVEGNGKEMDKEADLAERAEALEQKISDMGKSDLSDFAAKLRELGINNSTVKTLFGEDSKNTSGGINRIGDAGEGTGNFNATSFMSSMSSGINDALESYKDVMKAEKEANEEANEEVAQEAA